MVKCHPSSNTLISTEQRGEVHNKLYIYHTGSNLYTPDSVSLTSFARQLKDNCLPEKEKMESTMFVLALKRVLVILFIQLVVVQQVKVQGEAVNVLLL